MKDPVRRSRNQFFGPRMTRINTNSSENLWMVTDVVHGKKIPERVASTDEKMSVHSTQDSICRMKRNATLIDANQIALALRVISEDWRRLAFQPFHQCRKEFAHGSKILIVCTIEGPDHFRFDFD